MAVVGAHLSRWKLAAVGVALLLLPQVLSPYNTLIATSILILSLFSVSFNLLLGYSGLACFGHAGYYALGAYTAALLQTKLGVPMPLAFLAAPVVATGGAFVFGYFCVRRTHAYFIMLTLAFSQILYAIAFKWYDLTGGDNGVRGVYPPEELMTPVGSYYFTLIVAVVCIATVYRIAHSPFGAILQAIRENPQRAEALGIAVRRHQWAAFTIAGFFAGVAGALAAYYQRSVQPDYAFLVKSSEPLIATMLGGANYFFGPVVGSIIYVLLQRLVTRVTDHWLLVIGVLVAAIILWFPAGLLGINLRRIIARVTNR